MTVAESVLNPEALPVALVEGCAYHPLPHDLYIPPDALRIFLEAFEGPLDLLLYLIKKQNLDILNIPIAEVTRQYQDYIELMQGLKLELAAEYLLMAAMLAEIKSRLLLPRITANDDEDDPRAELIRRLKEYEYFKQAAENLDQLPRVERDIFIANVPMLDLKTIRPLPTVLLNELVEVLKDTLNRAQWRTPHHLQREILSVRERMTQVLSQLQANQTLSFNQLIIKTEGRQGVVVTFIALLELLKQTIIDIVQLHPYEDIHIRMC